MASDGIWKRGWPHRASSLYLTLVGSHLQVERLAFQFVNHAALHYELYPLELGHVYQRIALNRDDVGEGPRRDHADLVIPAEKIGRVSCRSLNRPRRRQAPFDHVRELFGVPPVRIN